MQSSRRVQKQWQRCSTACPRLSATPLSACSTVSPWAWRPTGVPRSMSAGSVTGTRARPDPYVRSGTRRGRSLTPSGRCRAQAHDHRRDLRPFRSPSHAVYRACRSACDRHRRRAARRCRNDRHRPGTWPSPPHLSGWRSAARAPGSYNLRSPTPSTGCGRRSAPARWPRSAGYHHPLTADQAHMLLAARASTTDRPATASSGRCTRRRTRVQTCRPGPVATPFRSQSGPVHRAICVLDAVQVRLVHRGTLADLRPVHLVLRGDRF
jgi:hypothetical protein